MEIVRLLDETIAIRPANGGLALGGYVYWY
jgi:hypothetical protein